MGTAALVRPDEKRKFKMSAIVLGVMSVLIGAIAYAIYIVQTIGKGGVQPHPFSWLLWAAVTGVACAVQVAQGGGAGSWVTGFTTIVCFFIGILTLLKHRWRFSWFDWASLGAGLFVLGFYILARNPTQSAILATLTDVIGYGPTIKKGWYEPYKDSTTSFGLNGLKFLVALPALGPCSIATWLYPMTIGGVNIGVAGMLRLRRLVVRNVKL